MARWASRSLARLRASCDGVNVDTLLVPVKCQFPVSYNQSTGSRCPPFRFCDLGASAEDDLVMLSFGSGVAEPLICDRVKMSDMLSEAALMFPCVGK